MSVLSRPVLHHASAPTQKEARIPQPRDGSPAKAVPRTEPAVEAPAAPPSAPSARRRIPTALIAAGAVGALLVVGGTTYLVMDDGGDAASVIAPAYVPTESDLARDRAAAARGPGGVDAATLISEAERDAALARRGQSLQP